jgi:predicted CoA-binding protein
MNEPETIAKILRESRVIAVVGLSDKPERPSYGVAEYLMEKGYRIVPVNPNIKEWKGLRAYQNITSIPLKVDVVDIFRKSEFVPDVVDEAIAIRAKALWMQLGVLNAEAAEKAERAGLLVVMGRCMKIEHSKMR